MAIILAFDYSHGRYTGGDVATWEVVDHVVRQALTPQPRYLGGKLIGRIPAARVVTRDEADRIIKAQRDVHKRARDKRGDDPGMDLLFLTRHMNHDVGDVVHLGTDAAAELLREEGPYFSNGIEIGRGPIVRPATQAERTLDARGRVEQLIREREQEGEVAPELDE